MSLCYREGPSTMIPRGRQSNDWLMVCTGSARTHADPTSHPLTRDQIC